MSLTTPPEGHCNDPAAWTEFVARYGPLPREQSGMGHLSDFALANAQYLADRSSLDLIVYQTAAKDRIRWLSVQLAAANARAAALRTAVDDALVELRAPWPGDGCVTRARDGLSAARDAQDAVGCTNSARPSLQGQPNASNSAKGDNA